MVEDQEHVRRTDFRLASKVQCGIVIQVVSGNDEAIRYLETCGVPNEVIDRVLSRPACRRQPGTIDVPDRLGQ